MIKQLYDILLHQKVKYTNIATPFSDYISFDKFPEQISELINTEVTLKYRNQALLERECYNIPSKILNRKTGKIINARPTDDADFLPRSEDSPEYLEEDRIKTDTFRVLRADNEAPNVFIAVSTDYSMIIVSSTKKDEEDKYIFERDPSIYPLQMNEYIALTGITQYAGQVENFKCYLLSLSSNEPLVGVIMEVIDEESNTVRFVLSDECYMSIGGYVDPDLTPQDLPSWVRYNRWLTKFQIEEFRKNLLKDVVIYGEVQG